MCGACCGVGAGCRHSVSMLGIFHRYNSTPHRTPHSTPQRGSGTPVKKNTIMIVTLLCLLSVEHIVYTLVCFFPRIVSRWIQTFTNNEIEFLHAFLICQKCLQAMSLGIYYSRHRSSHIVVHSDISYIGTGWGILMVAFGQILNAAVYNALGRVGVYYGNYFDKHIPWTTMFPYNIPWLKHPQYVGTLCTWYGGACIVYHVVANAPRMLLRTLLVFQTLNYIAMATVEDYTSTGKQKQKKQ